MSPTIEIQVITAAETLPVRQSVLRPGRPVAVAQFPEDAAPSTRHFGAFRDGKLLGIASLFRSEMPEFRELSAIQLRGMATAPEIRGQGFGRALLLTSLCFAREHRVQLFWCHARIGAVGFYRKLEFEIFSGEFEIPDVGPHVRMGLRLNPAPSGKS